MQIISGKLNMLGNSSQASNYVTYSTIEIDQKNINGLSIGSGLDNYLNASMNKECTLYINNKSIIGIDTNNKTYYVDAPTTSISAVTFISGFFCLILFALALMNFVDGIFGRRVDGGNILACLLFVILGGFAAKSAMKNFRTLNNLKKLSKKENSIKV